MVRAPAAKAGGPGFDSRWLSWFSIFSLQADLLVDEICGALVQLGCYINRDMNGKIYGGLVQFSCYQYRMELGVCGALHFGCYQHRYK